MPDLGINQPLGRGAALTLSAAEQTAVAELVGKLDHHYPGEIILAASVADIRALATTSTQRSVIARILRLRPEDVGASTPRTASRRVGLPQHTIVDVDILQLIAPDQYPQWSAADAVVRLTGQQYFSRRQGVLADMRPVLLATSALAAFVALQRAANADLGHPLLVMSQYRSPGHQLAVILRELHPADGDIARVLRGVALPGYSEHQDLRRPAFDFGTPEGRIGDEFMQSAEHRWLQANAARFRFVASYPPGNTTGIKHEPWHWRYMGSNRASSPG